MARIGGTRASTPLIATKIAIPRRRGDTLRRARLVDAVHHMIDLQLYLVVAPAGYGKTTLLVDFASDTDMPVCWYSLGPTDTEPATFIEYLVASIQARFPRFGSDTRRVLAQTNFRTNAMAVVAALVNEVQERIPDYFAVVLDDYHEVHRHPAINQIVDALFKYAPENLKFIISSREIPLLQLSRLAARRQAAGLGAKELRFTSDEVRDLMRESYQTVLPDRVVEELTARSEGWITGIILTTHTMWQGLFESMIRKSGQEQLYGYLANEVFERQSPARKRFLLASSILDDMDPAIAGPLAGTARAEDILHQLEEGNLFVAELEGRKRVYRYHHLFRDFLRSRVEEGALGLSRADLERRAGLLYQQRGQHEQAIGHLLAASAFDEAAESILAFAEDVFNRGRLETLAGWICRLPEELRGERPRLALWQAQVAIQQGELQQAIDLCQAIEAQAQPTDPLLAAEAQAHHAAAIRLLGDDEQALALSRHALAIFGDEVTRRRALATRNMSMAHWRLGALTRARDEAQQALALFIEVGDEASAAYVQNDLGMLAIFLGSLGEARQHLERSAKFWRDAGNAGRLGLTLSNLGVIAYLEEDYKEAVKLFTSAIEESKAGLFPFAEAVAACSLGDVYRDTGDFQRAFMAYGEARALVTEGTDRAELAVVLNSMAQAYRLQGMYAKASGALRSARNSGATGYRLAQLQLTEAICLVERGQHRAAEEPLTKALETFRSGGARYAAARALFYRAIIEAKKGYLAKSDALLKECLATLEQLGYWQFLAVDAPRSEEFVLQAPARGIGEDFLTRLLARQPGMRRVRKPKPHRMVQRAPRLTATALGHIHVTLGGRVIPAQAWGTQSARELLFFLLMHPEGVGKERLMTMLAPDAPPARANAKFHMATYRLRRALYKGCIQFEGDVYQLDPDLEVKFDVDDLQALLAAAEGASVGSPDEREALCSAVVLYGGPFLEGSYAEWVLTEQRHLEERFLNACVRLASLHLRAGEHSDALAVAERGLNVDDSLEELQIIVVRSLMALGREAEARKRLRTYGISWQTAGSAPVAGEAHAPARTASRSLVLLGTPGD